MLAPVRIINIMLAVLALSAMLGAGCATEKKQTSAILASVEIRDRAPSQIADTAAEVFREHGYEVARQGKRGLTFEKMGSGLSRFAYGDWASGNKVWERVTLSMVPVGATLWRLDCNAYLVTNKGESTEEPVKYGHVRRAPLQAMLEEIATHLRQLPEETPGPVEK